MARRNFRKTALDSLKPEAGRKQTMYFDQNRSGLALLVSAGGTRTMFAYYHLNGKTHYLGLGVWPDGVRARLEQEWKGDPGKIKAKDILSFAEREASKVRALAKQGTDPKEEIKRTKKHTTAFVTIDFIENHAKAENKTWRETARYLGLKPDPEDPDKLLEIKDGFVAKFGDRPIVDITRDQVQALRASISKRGARHAANRSHAAFRKLFNWAAGEGYLNESPLKGTKAPHKETQRDRVLSDDELKQLWGALDGLDWPWEPYFRALILTGQRRGEIATMQWHHLHLDSDKPMWVIPAELNKADRIHEVPLVPELVEILRSCTKDHQGRKRATKGPYVFSTMRGLSPVSGFSKAKQQIDKEAGITEPWRIHDIRRTAASGMARLNCPPHVLASILNHAPGSTQGITAIYNRYAYGDEKRMALEAWARYVIGLVEGWKAEVVALRG